MIPKIIQLSDLRTLHWRSKMPAGGAPPIVFLHGVGDGADIWRTVVSEWPGGLMTDAYAFDLPGHGGSSRMAAADYQVKNVATMIAETLMANNIKYPILVGHSLGGRIVLEMVAKALLIPHLTVLVDINPDPVEGAKGAIDEHLDILIKGAPTTKGLIENIKASLPLSDSRVLSKVIPTLLSAGPRLRTANKAMPFDPHIKNYMQAEPGLDEWDLIAQLNSPLAFVRGSFSSICDRQIDIKMSSLAPRFLGVEVIKGAGHAICLEQPVALAGALANLISKALRGA